MLPAEDISHFKPNIAFPQMIFEEVKFCSRFFSIAIHWPLYVCDCDQHVN